MKKTKTSVIFRIVGILLLFSYSGISHAQYYNQRSVNKILNRAMGTVATGQFSGTEIANYASFDPLDGSFSFKGVIPFISKNADTGRISFLSIKASGDIMSGSYASLFSNSALNTNMTVRMEYNVRLWGDGISVFKTTRQSFEMDRVLLNNSYANRRNDVARARQSLQRDTNLSRIERDLLLTEVTSLETWKVEAEHRLARQLSSAQFQDARKLQDSIKEINQEILDKKGVMLKLSRSLDSLYFVASTSSQRINFFTALENQIAEDSVKDLNRIESKYLLARLKFDWITFIAGGSKLKYYTFNSADPLQSQLKKEEYGIYQFGIAYNYYFQDLFRSKLFYLNAGLSYCKTNDIESLPTKELYQELIYQNSSKDTVRKLIRKYEVYTDSLTTRNFWNVYANIYMMRGSRTAYGFHFFPNVEFRNDKKTIYNAGLGFVASFINEKKDKPAINAEMYYKFLDLGNTLESGKRFFERNEIGISFTLPFTILLN